MGNKQSGKKHSNGLKKIAIVMGGVDYSQSNGKYYAMPQSSRDVLEMEEFLKVHDYKIYYNNLSVYDKFNYQGKVYSGTVLEKLETLLQKANLAKEKKKFYHFFIYFSGHGLMHSETKETSGVDSYGDLIPFDIYSKRFSQYKNVFTTFFLDCSREEVDHSLKKKKMMEVFHEPKGISIVKYGVDKGQRKHAVEYPELSKETKAFLNIFRSGEQKDLRMLLEMNKNYLLRAIPEKDWPKGKIFDTKIRYIKTKLAAQNPFKSSNSVMGEYVGFFKDNNIYGFGTFKYVDELFTEENFEYCGEWKNCLMDGEGQLALGNGEKFIGTFTQGRLNGAARIYYNNGTIKFEGDFKEGKQHGNGKLYKQNGNFHLDADFEDGSIKVSRNFEEYKKQQSTTLVGAWSNLNGRDTSLNSRHFDEKLFKITYDNQTDYDDEDDDDQNFIIKKPSILQPSRMDEAQAQN